MHAARSARTLFTRAAFFGLLAAGPAALAEEQMLHKGTVELSTAASFAHTTSEDSDEGITFATLPLRAGAFATRSLSAEGELALSHFRFYDESRTRFVFSGSALYHFQPEARAVPFLIAGAGIGNGFDALGPLDLFSEADARVVTLHAGAGLKVKVADSAALRVEYRFTHAMVKSDGSFDEPSYSDTVHTHRVFVGFSVFVH